MENNMISSLDLVSFNSLKNLSDLISPQSRTLIRAGMRMAGFINIIMVIKKEIFVTDELISELLGCKNKLTTGVIVKSKINKAVLYANKNRNIRQKNLLPALSSSPGVCSIEF